MLKISKIGVLIFAAILLWCACLEEKLPQKIDYSPELKIAYDYFLLLEKGKTIEPEIFVEKSNNQDLISALKLIKCSYSELQCNNLRLNDSLDFQFFAQFIYQVNHRQDGAEETFRMVNTPLKKIDSLGLADYYYQIFTKEPYEIQTAMSKDDLIRFSKEDYTLADILELVKMSSFHAGKFDVAYSDALNALILHCIKSIGELNSMHRLKASILEEISIVHIQEGSKINFLKQTYDEILGIDSLIGAGFWREKVLHKLDHLIIHSADMAEEEIIQFYKQEIENLPTIDSNFIETVYLEIGYILYEKIVAEGGESSFGQSLFERALNYSNDECGNDYFYSSEYLFDLLLHNHNVEKAQFYLDQLRLCDSLNLSSDLILTRLNEHLNGFLCINSRNVNSCKEAYETQLRQDTIITNLMAAEDALHLSDYLAEAAKDKFEYLEQLEAKDSEMKWSQIAFDELQKTKYRIFDYRSNYDKVLSKPIAKKIEALEKEINAGTIDIEAFENYDGETSDYVELVLLNMEKSQLLENGKNVSRDEAEINDVNKINEIKIASGDLRESSHRILSI